MAHWTLKISRYDRGALASRISGTIHLTADNFDRAVDRARDHIAGMAAADPGCDFRVVSLATHDYRGTDCEGGIFPFETREEMSARVSPK